MTQKQQQFLTVYERLYATTKAACTAAKISRSTFYEWMKQEEFKEALEDIRESLLDNAESKLHELINGVMVEGRTNGKITVYKRPPDFRAIKFFLSTKGKDRGYTERFEVENNNKCSQILTIVVDYGESKGVEP
jgi:hypothetical protein